MATVAELTAAQAEVFATMRILATSPEGTVQSLGGRNYTQKNLGELQQQYDWLGKKISDATRAAAAATAAGGGAGVVEFGPPSA